MARIIIAIGKVVLHTCLYGSTIASVWTASQLEQAFCEIDRIGAKLIICWHNNNYYNYAFVLHALAQAPLPHASKPMHNGLFTCESHLVLSSYSWPKS